MDIIHQSGEFKLFGHGEASVLAVKDGTTRGHYVKVFHPDFGETDYIPFVQSPGLYRVPRVGDQCFVFCNENFFEYPVAWGHKMSTALVQQLVGTRQDNITILYSSGPDNNSITHRIELDDGDDKAVRIITNGGHKILLNDTKNTIESLHKNGAKIVQTDKDITISVMGTSIVLDNNGIKMVSAKGATFDILDKIEGKSSMGSNIKLNQSVRINATDQLATVDMVIISQHDHVEGNLGYPTAMGPFRVGSIE